MTDTTDIAALRDAAALIAHGYKQRWGCETNEDTGFVGVGTFDHDGDLCPFIEVSVSNWSDEDGDDERLAEFLTLANPVAILALLGMLEAERQRADANAQEIRRLEFQWEHRAPTQWAYDQACTALHAQRERAEVAEKERDTLKSAHGNMVARCALLRQRTDLPVDRIPAYNSLVKAQEELTELREKLAKPVVLPAGYSTRTGHPFHEGERNVMIPNKHGDWLSRFDVEHAIQVAGFPFTNKDVD